MKTKIIILLIGGGIALGSIFFLKNKVIHQSKIVYHQPVTPNQKVKAQKTTQEKNNKQPLNLLDFLKKNPHSSLKCTLTYNNQQVTFYFKNNLLRLDGIKDTANIRQGSMLQTQDKIYIWSNQEKKGIIFPIENNTQKTTTSPGENQPINIHQLLKNMDQQKYQCQIANLNDNLFQPPKDIHFLDLGNLKTLR